MIVKIVRYLLGYIHFRAFGGFSDRFLNLCTREGIPLWNIKNIKGNISATTTIQGYFALRRPAKKSGMRVISLERKGLVFLIRKNKLRLGLVTGMVAFATVIFILSQFVWSVSLVGNVELSEDVLLREFEEQGVYVGALISSVDSKDAAQQVVRENGELSWAAVNRKGTAVVIEVREKTPAPEEYDKSVPTNLVAGENGLILSVDVLCGTEEIKPGSAVVKGDLLISGVVAYADGREVLVHGDGYVRALVSRNEKFSITDFKLYSLESERTRKKLFLFGLEIPLGKQVGSDFFTSHKSFIETEKTTLPLGIISEYGASFSDEEADADDETASMLTLWSSAFYVKELLDFSVVKSTAVTKLSEAEYSLSAECEQEIGVLQEIYVKD